MKRNELIKLRKMVDAEVCRRKRINELLDNELVKEYLKLADISSNGLDYNDKGGILEEILKDFEITKTNGIYVCVNAYYVDYYMYTEYVSINSEYADYRRYCDIESKEIIRAKKSNKVTDIYNNPLISEFEQNNIVLNPFNTRNYNNGYWNVRNYFFENALEYGQAKAKKLVLERYPRL